jgi:hypothetical protein
MDGTERTARYGIDKDNERGIRAVRGYFEGKPNKQK